MEGRLVMRRHHSRVCREDRSERLIVKQDTLAQLNAERLARRPLVVITDVAKDPLRAELDKHLRMGRSELIQVDGDNLFLNIYAPTARLIIIGAVHISQTLAPLAQSLGYDVCIVDPRSAFASPERFPDVQVIADWPETVLPPMNVDRYTAVAALTHYPKFFDFALLHALVRDCFFIGALKCMQQREIIDFGIVRQS